MGKNKLQDWLKNGIIDLDVLDVQSIMKMKKDRELLKSFPYKYWQGKDGKWYVHLPDEKKGRTLKKRNSKIEIEQVIIDYQNGIINNPTVDELFNEWNDYRLELRKISKASHTRMQDTYKRFFKEFGKKRIKNLEKDEIVEFLERQIPKYNLSARGFAGLKTIMKGVLKRARRKKYIDFTAEEVLAELDVSDVEFRKTIREDYEEVYNEEEMYNMLMYLRDNYNLRNAAVILMFVSGMRIGEIVALKHEDLDPWNNTVKVRRTETRYKENGETIYAVKEYPKTKAGIRTIVIPSAYRWLIRDLHEQSKDKEYVFQNDKGKRYNTNQIRKDVYKACKDTGTYKKSPHKIRATYDTILLDSNVDRRMVKDQMGHSEIKTSEVKYHRNRKTEDKKREIMDSIPDFKII